MQTEQLLWIRERTEELSALLCDPQVIAERARWDALMAEYKCLRPLAELLEEMDALDGAKLETQKLLDDPQMREIAAEEIDHLERALTQAHDKLAEMLRGEEHGAQGSVILEIRAGAGGEEAALFAAMLLRMYVRYAERRGWESELLSLSESEMGGAREAILRIAGPEAYRRLAGECGVHRIQRIPVTESNGKRQTSTATVAVLPEVGETELTIAPEDLRLDLFRASGHGGQHINKTDSAVRLTHLPTGIVVTCQQERSQLRNKEKAMEILRARLYDRLDQAQKDALAGDRRAQVGTGDRSERVRTYNFNDGRITDHRIGKTIQPPEPFLDGEMDALIDPLLQKLEADAMAAKQDTP